MKAAWTIFVDNYLIKADHIAAYQTAYPGTNRKTAATKGKQLLDKPEIAQRIAELQKKKSAIVEATRQKAIQTAAVGDVIAETEVDAILSKIIKGELEVEKVLFNRQGVPVRIKVKPDHADILAAADKYYRRFGSYKDDKLGLGDAEVVINIRKAPAGA